MTAPWSRIQWSDKTSMMQNTIICMFKLKLLPCNVHKHVHWKQTNESHMVNPLCQGINFQLSFVMWFPDINCWQGHHRRRFTNPMTQQETTDVENHHRYCMLKSKLLTRNVHKLVHWVQTKEPQMLNPLRQSPTGHQISHTVPTLSPRDHEFNDPTRK